MPGIFVRTFSTTIRTMGLVCYGPGRVTAVSRISWLRLGIDGIRFGNCREIGGCFHFELKSTHSSRVSFHGGFLSMNSYMPSHVEVPLVLLLHLDMRILSSVTNLMTGTMGPSSSKGVSYCGFPCQHDESFRKGKSDQPASTILKTAFRPKASIGWPYRLSQYRQVERHQHFAGQESRHGRPYSWRD